MGTKFNRAAPSEKPPPGLHHAVCVDVVMLGIRKTAFGDKPKVAIVWMLDPTLKNTKGFPFYSRKHYTSSLHPKSALSVDLCSWFNLPNLSESQINGFSEEGGPDKLIGLNCQLQIVHAPADDGGVWANIKSVLPPPPHVAKLSVPANFVRDQDKPENAGASSGGGGGGDEQGHNADDADSECPF